MGGRYTDEQRRARGLQRVRAWVEEDVVDTLDDIAEIWECSRTEALIRAVRLAKKAMKKL